MVTGSHKVEKPFAEAIDRLKLILASNGCQTYQPDGTAEVGFSWPGAVGKYPVVGAFRLAESDGSTAVEYQAEVRPSDRLMGVLWATLFCWAVYPPIITYRAFRDEPRQFVEIVLRGL